MLTVGRLKELFRYDPETGEFTRLVHASSNARAGDVIRGCKAKNGYLTIRADNKLYYAHRLAWLYVHGKWPSANEDIDHINGDRTDNRITNIRRASRTENNRNRRAANKNSQSGHIGIHFSSRHGKWIAHVTVDRKFKSLGYFDTLDQAIAARQAGEARYFGSFRRV